MEAVTQDVSFSLTLASTLQFTRGRAVDARQRRSVARQIRRRWRDQRSLTVATAQLRDSTTARVSRMEPTHVLVVSGEDLTRVLAAIALGDAGYDVLEASSVSEALERLDDDAVDTIALDASFAETHR